MKKSYSRSMLSINLSRDSLKLTTYPHENLNINFIKGSSWQAGHSSHSDDGGLNSVAAIVSKMGPSFLNGTLFLMSFFMICSLIYMKNLTKKWKLSNVCLYLMNYLFIFITILACRTLVPQPGIKPRLLLLLLLLLLLSHFSCVWLCVTP